MPEIIMKNAGCLLNRFAAFAFILSIAGFQNGQAVAAPQEPGGEALRAGIDAGGFANALAAAKPGQTVTLPEGLLRVGDLAVPAGVNLRGAGYGKTIIDATGFRYGVVVRDAKAVEVSDLTVKGATVADIQVSRSGQVIIARVLVRDGVSGIAFSDVTEGRVENCVSVANRCGLLMQGGRRNVIVNCSVITNSGIGISLPSGAGAMVFNNAIVGNATGVYLGLDLSELRLDYNLYFNLYMGKLGEQLARPHLGDWKSLSMQDTHSVQFPATLEDDKAGDYAVVNPLEWSPNRTVSSDWGIEQLGDVKAPQADIKGRKRQGVPDVGAYETELTPARPADGTFEIKSGQGLASAGIFTKEGREVAYLFQNLPLRKGRYSFWFPARTFEGKFIPPGQYDIRIAESDLSWEYLGWIGDTGAVANARLMATIGGCYALFDQDVLYVASGWSEDDTCLRCYRLSDQKVMWSMPGRDGATGLVKGDDGFLYVLRPVQEGGELLRIDPATGRTAPPWGANKTGQISFEKGALFRDLVSFEGKFFVLDPSAGVIRHGDAQNPIPWAGSFPAPKAQFMGLDSKGKLLWVLTSEGKLQARKPAGGSIVSQYDPQLSDVAALTVGEGTLALASRSTGKVHFFDTTDPANVKAGKTFGRGDGPYGLYLPDRFTFQKPAKGYTHLALNAKGDLSVIDGRRQVVFDPQQNLRWFNFGIGSNPFPSFADPLRMYMENYTFLVDEMTGTWKPEGFWNIPWPNPDTSKFLGDFKFKDHTFLLYGLPDRFEVYEFIGAGAKLVFSLSGNSRAPNRWSKLLENGNVVASNKGGWATVWKFGGLDEAGKPLYRDSDAISIPRKADSVVSPFTYEVSDKAHLSLGTVTKNGGIVGNVGLGTSPYGTGWSNTAGTDMAEINPDGTLRWFHPLGMYGGTPGFADLKGIYLEGVNTQPQLIAVNPDGLGLGTAGLPAKVNYEGFWMDYEGSLQGYIGKDGRRYAMIGDNIKGCGHWFRLHNEENIVMSSQPAELSEETARHLKAMNVPKPGKVAFRPPTPTVRIPKLNKPLPMDGDLAKWRALDITPQIVITPETAVGGIKGPADASAVVRIAHLGSDLYVQILRFDNVVTFHQPVSKMYMQDSVELCLNGFMDGFKVMVSPTTDQGTAMRGEKFLGKSDLVSEQHAPRVVKVLDDAKSVTEREMIESVYGIDMSGCKVIVTEFKLPLDKESFAGNPAAQFATTPGSKFWLGLLINDNDEPGSDIQRYLYWPATYSTFQPKEDGAQAILE
jgi:hypothetical protein